MGGVPARSRKLIMTGDGKVALESKSVHYERGFGVSGHQIEGGLGLSLPQSLRLCI